MNCFDKCPRKTFQYNQTCVQNCPFSKPYNFKGNCVDICSHFLMKKTCYKQCPSGLVGYQKKCHLQCPFKARYKYKWECIPQCPKNTLNKHVLIRVRKVNSNIFKSALNYAQRMHHMISMENV